MQFKCSFARTVLISWRSVDISVLLYYSINRKTAVISVSPVISVSSGVLLTHVGGQNVVKIRVTVLPGLPGHGHTAFNQTCHVPMSNVRTRARLGVRIEPENMNLLHVRMRIPTKKKLRLVHNL